MSNFLDEYSEVVTPIIPLFEDTRNSNRKRTVLHHQVGLINACISVQQFILMGNHIEKTEGTISINRMAGIIAEIVHLQSDRMAFMSDMDDDILAAVVDGLHPIVARVIEAMGIEWGNPYGE